MNEEQKEAFEEKTEDTASKDNKNADCDEESRSGTSEEQVEKNAEESDRAEDEVKETEIPESRDKEVCAEETVDYKDKWMRVTAEYQNYRTRTQKEKEEIYSNANAKFVEGLLDVIDNFERAMQTKPDGDAFADGIELIYKQFLAILEKNHVKEISGKGERFDPKIHNAVQVMAVEGLESDMVAEVIKKGYTLNDKVIRPAIVVVSQ